MAVGDAIESTLSSKAYSLPRVPAAESHPLFSSSSSSLQVEVVDEENGDTLDPLRVPHSDRAVPFQDFDCSENASRSETSGATSMKHLVKEWITFKRLLMQKFPTSKTVCVSSIADSVMGHHKASEKSTAHLDELDDPQGSADEDAKIVTQQEYIARLTDLKSEIAQAWHADDHVKSLKLTVKVARLLRDTALLQFYPTLFSLVTDILDMLGDMVWERIKRKAEFSEDGVQIHSLREDFGPSDVSSDAKEVCHNWFCKIGSIRELLPRIYLELAILPCWKFLRDDTVDVLPRLVTMMRGLGDPLASAYCHMYLAYCAQRLLPQDRGYLVTSIRNMNIVMAPIMSSRVAADDKSSVRNLVLVRLMEPPVEYIMKCIFKDPHQEASDMLLEAVLGRNMEESLLGKSSCVSLILHLLLKELPPEMVNSNAVKFLDLINGSADASFDQCMNFRLLGFRLYEKDSSLVVLNVVLDRIIQVVSQYQDLEAYLKIVDGYVDIILQHQMKSRLETVLKGIADRACNKWIGDSEMESLRSVFVKILTHQRHLKEVLELNHLIEIMDVMRGSARHAIYMRILEMAMRNGNISCPTTIEFLFQICQGLHEGVNSNMLEADSQHLSRLLTRFVEMVDFGTDWKIHLAFFVRCRGAFDCADELKETLVHHGNCLAIKALKASKMQSSFVRSCLAFCEATIPSVLTPVKQLILYLETAEVALLSGLASHTDGLLDSAMTCLQSIVLFNDPGVSLDVDRIISMIQKLCSILVIIPGNPSQGIGYFPRTLRSLVNSQSSWMTTRLKVRALCAIISFLGASGQTKLPYNVCGIVEVPGNHLMFFDDPVYQEEIRSLCHCVLQDVLHAIRLEKNTVARGNLALDACNCIAAFLKMNDNTLGVCKELMEIAQSSLSRQHKYLESTSEFVSTVSRELST